MYPKFVDEPYQIEAVISYRPTAVRVWSSVEWCREAHEV